MPVESMIYDPDRALALVYAPAAARAALATLWRLDEALAQVVRTTSEPLVGRMRLTWWHDALLALAEKPAPAEPLLRDVEAHLKPHIRLERLAPLIDGWEALLDPLPLAADAIADHAAGRGEAMFAVAVDLLGGSREARFIEAGRLWALADLAGHVSDPETAERARQAGRAAIAGLPRRWPRHLRAIGALAVLARGDLEGKGRPRGSPARTLRALGHRLSGY
ncbi:MAG: hypothetical protein DI623_11740 [Sphingomonas sanxanigenens]|uniref:Phytoene synthase n=1 Tax=Sphingomonas sanxanigenens TaxID=397260 RepID=A0A2W5C0T8_9SPHN|nr:MAG: hypothetical protein DI623_11740 [Sphingomonas sanxanigenens]